MSKRRLHSKRRVRKNKKKKSKGGNPTESNNTNPVPLPRPAFSDVVNVATKMNDFNQKSIHKRMAKFFNKLETKEQIAFITQFMAKIVTLIISFNLSALLDFIAKFLDKHLDIAVSFTNSAESLGQIISIGGCIILMIFLIVTICKTRHLLNKAKDENMSEDKTMELLKSHKKDYAFKSLLFQGLMMFVNFGVYIIKLKAGVSITAAVLSLLPILLPFIFSLWLYYKFYNKSSDIKSFDSNSAMNVGMGGGRISEKYGGAPDIYTLFIMFPQHFFKWMKNKTFNETKLLEMSSKITVECPEFLQQKLMSLLCKCYDTGIMNVDNLLSVGFPESYATKISDEFKRLATYVRKSDGGGRYYRRKTRKRTKRRKTKKRTKRRKTKKRKSRRRTTRR